MIFIIAQIVALIAWIFFLISYFGKNVNKVIILQVISDIFYCINYLLLGAISGLFVTIFDLIKEIGYYKTDKDKYIFYFTIPIYILIAFYSEKSFLMIIPIIASIIDGYAVIKSKKAIVIGAVVSNFLWLIYDLFYLDYIVAGTDLTVIIVNIGILLYGYSKFIRRDYIYTLNRKNISLTTLKRICSLDKDYYDKVYCWNLDYMTNLYKKEKDSYILIKDKNTIIGYVNLLNIKKDVYDKMLESDTLYDNFNLDDIINYSNSRVNYYLNLNSIVLKNEYQNKNSSMKIKNAIIKYINKEEKKGYKIKEINSYAVNDYEVEILERLGFEKVKNITNECFLYRLVR